MNIRFVNLHKFGVSDAFSIEDGGSIYINGKEKSVNYIDSTHFLVDMKCYHNLEFFDKIVLNEQNIVLPGKGLVLKHQYSNLWSMFKKETYSRIYIKQLNRSFLFNDLHIIPESLPLGMYSYDIRYSEDNNEPCTIEPKVRVNHFGSIISPVPLFDLNTKNENIGDNYINIEKYQFFYGKEEYEAEKHRFCVEHLVEPEAFDIILNTLNNTTEVRWLKEAKREVS